MQEGVALLVITAAAYLAGLLVLVVVAAFKFNRLWCGVLLAYVVVPGAYVYISGSADQAASDRVEEDFRLGTERNLQAFADYCKDRRRVIHRTVPPATEDSLLIRLEHEPHKRSDFEAYSIHQYFNTGRQRSICEKTSVAYLAGNDKFYVSDKQAFQTEMRLFRLCSLEGGVATPRVRSRYELLIVDGVDRKPSPWRGATSWMSQSSLVLQDRETGEKAGRGQDVLPAQRGWRGRLSQGGEADHLPDHGCVSQRVKAERNSLGYEHASLVVAPQLQRQGIWRRRYP